MMCDALKRPGLWRSSHVRNPQSVSTYHNQATALWLPRSAPARNCPVNDPLRRETASGCPGRRCGRPRRRLRPEVDHVIGRLDDVEVVLDHDDGVTLVDQLAQHSSSLRVSSKCSPVVGFVEDVHRASRPRRDSSPELDALRLAATQGRGGLASSMYPSPTRCSVRSLLAIEGKFSISGSACRR